MKHILLFIIIVNMVCFSFAQSDANEVTKNETLQQAFHDLSNGSNSFVSFSSKEDTKGSRYFNGNWVKGSVVGSNNIVYNDQGYFYNYDKISHHLFMTSNKKDVIEIDDDKVKSFTLNNNMGVDYSFEKIPALDQSAFLQVIAKDSAKYSAYKLTKTKFVKANYHTDGLVESGKNYDEYVDETEYYIGFKNNNYKKIDLNKKSLSKSLADNPKVQAYFKDHKDDEINESFLFDLLTYLNKN
jgi:hypothetical protein